MKFKNEKGNVAIIFCVAITLIFAFTAYVIDIGIVYIEKTRLSNALDSAALAGALELIDSEEKARAEANEYLIKNNVNPEDTVLFVSEDGKALEIQGQKKVTHIFAQVIGINDSIVRARTKAIVAPLKGVEGKLRPFAVEDFDYTYGEQVVLKEGAGDGYNGNYGAVALGGTGASNFEANALYGYKGKIIIGDYIPTETGNMAGATSSIKNYINTESSSFDNFERGSIRLWTLPLVNTLYVDGRKDILVVGFGQFYVEDVQNNIGKIEVTGRFVRYITSGEVDKTLVDKGLYGVKLER